MSMWLLWCFIFVALDGVVTAVSSNFGDLHARSNAYIAAPSENDCFWRQERSRIGNYLINTCNYSAIYVASWLDYMDISNAYHCSSTLPYLQQMNQYETLFNQFWLQQKMNVTKLKTDKQSNLLIHDERSNLRTGNQNTGTSDTSDERAKGSTRESDYFEIEQRLAQSQSKFWLKQEKNIRKLSYKCLIFKNEYTLIKPWWNDRKNYFYDKYLTFSHKTEIEQNEELIYDFQQWTKHFYTKFWENEENVTFPLLIKYYEKMKPYGSPTTRLEHVQKGGYSFWKSMDYIYSFNEENDSKHDSSDDDDNDIPLTMNLIGIWWKNVKTYFIKEKKHLARMKDVSDRMNEYLTSIKRWYHRKTMLDKIDQMSKDDSWDQFPSLIESYVIGGKKTFESLKQSKLKSTMAASGQSNVETQQQDSQIRNQNTSKMRITREKIAAILNRYETQDY